MTRPTTRNPQPATRNPSHGTRNTEHETRLARLRRRVMGTAPSICHERAALVTRRYERDGTRYPPILLRAYALADVLEGMTVYIGL